MFGGIGARSLEAALRDLRSPDARVRASAARDLARHEGEHVIAALTEALGDESGAVRGAAAVAIADAGLEALAPTLVLALDDEDPHVKQMALMALGELRVESAVDRVARELEAAEPPVRFQAVMAFPRVCRDRERAVRALLEATHDDDPLVVHIALRMAEELGDEGGAVADRELLKRARQLLDDENDPVRLAAAVMLGRSGSREGADVLVAAANRGLQTNESEDEAAAIELCGELELSEATFALEQRAFAGLLSRDPFAWHARVALASMGHDRAVRWILSELDAWTRERRSLAVAAVTRARIAAARSRLEAMRGHPERADPDAVEEALAVLGNAR